MCSQVFLLTTILCVGSLAAQRIPEKRLTSRSAKLLSIPTLKADASEQHGDHVPAETGFTSPLAAATNHHGSKYFQDIYVAKEKPQELSFGHVKETPHDWEQRFEKINLQNLNRQGKVRWGDKHGGYGEHYWDYNHAGHGDGDGEESQQHTEYASYQDESKDDLSALDGIGRGKREQTVPEDVEFINDRAKSLLLDGRGQKHGGNYRKANDFRGKREQKKKFGKSFVFEPDQAIVVDQDTGRRYALNPIE